MNYDAVAKDILTLAGGPGNVENLTHCFTRLRLELSDRTKADKEKLAQLNALTHPAVKAWIRKDIEEKRKQDVKIYVIEAALLIQDGYKEICDEIWYIYVNEETRIKRLMKQRGYTEERCRAMFHSQEPESYYRKYADFTINNQLDYENSSKQLKDRLNILLGDAIILINHGKTD